MGETNRPPIEAILLLARARCLVAAHNIDALETRNVCEYALQIERLAGSLSDALEYYIGMADEATLDELYDEVVCRHTVLRAALEREQQDDVHVFAEFTPMTDNGFTKTIPNVGNPELGSIPPSEPDDRQQDAPQGPFANTMRPPADKETSRIPRLMICNHPPSEIVSGDEGTSYCGACQREKEVAQEHKAAPEGGSDAVHI